MPDATVIDLGVFVVGERPVPLLYAFKDAAGGIITLTGFTARFQYAERWATTGAEAAAVVSNGAAGEVTYAWTHGGEFAQPGRYRGFVWAGNGGSQRHASPPILWTVLAGVPGLPPPSV